MKNKSFRLISVYVTILSLIILFATPPAFASADEKQNHPDDVYRLSVTYADVFAGESVEIKVENLKEKDTVEVSSSDDSIVSVSQKDNSTITCTAKNAGSATITVMVKQPRFIIFSKEQAALTCTINVSPRAISLRFNEKRLKMKVNKTRTVHVTTKPFMSGEAPYFYSANSNVAIVDQSGVVTAVGRGKTFIYARIHNGKTARLRVLVKK
jgi:uncharacterized protein YjdB